MKYLAVLQARYSLLPIKLRLFFDMLIAANSAALAIWICFKYLMDNQVEYRYCLGMFLILRVMLFMANKQMPLNDENVAFMSSDRTLWNGATIAVSTVMICIFFIADIFY